MGAAAGASHTAFFYAVTLCIATRRRPVDSIDSICCCPSTAGTANAGNLDPSATVHPAAVCPNDALRNPAGPFVAGFDPATAVSSVGDGGSNRFESDSARV